MKPGKRGRNEHKKPSPPVERTETIRQKIMALVGRMPLSAKELSKEIMVPEKDICDHLEHIRKTSNTRERYLSVTPAHCRKCGFEFRKRERLTRPGKCPICRSGLITEPLFQIETSGKRTG
ncbi:MAG: transcriptional regulator [Nitrospirota bacterium]